MRFALSSKAGFRVAAGVVAHTLWTSAAPAMVYPLYAGRWHLTPSVTTGIFAVYPVTVVAVLVLFGNLSDQVGRRLAMLYGVAASAAGVLLFALANNVVMLLAGRALMGIGVGLSAGPSAAALVDFAEDGAGVVKAGAATLASQAAGLAAALLVGGALVQYAPAPMRLSFWLLFALLLMLLAGIFLLPRQASNPGSVSGWRPALPRVPPGLRKPFGFAAFTVMTAYFHGVLIASLGSQVARDLVRSDNALVNGAALALFAITLGVVGLLARRLRPDIAIAMGAVASLAGMAFLAVAVLAHSLTSFLAATVASGMGYAWMVYGGLAMINAVASQAVRGGMTSAVFLLAYLFTGLAALGLGHLATIATLGLATLTGAGLMAGLCVVVVVLTVLPRRMSPGRPNIPLS
ncbi:MFS transporter [Nitrospirillum amazonense]|uniref:MFS transporter n=1 Tax=Nitrospirillum amazonense TaxID=28077 RepID=UPI002412772F|nr:MFS transporter [Nitrospirillum amazonense]MDG3439084.1 MFS transporter [Nitrospirillum amazonense]